MHQTYETNDMMLQKKIRISYYDYFLFFFIKEVLLLIFLGTTVFLIFCTLSVKEIYFLNIYNFFYFYKLFLKFNEKYLQYLELFHGGQVTLSHFFRFQQDPWNKFPILLIHPGIW